MSTRQTLRIASRVLVPLSLAPLLLASILVGPEAKEPAAPAANTSGPRQLDNTASAEAPFLSANDAAMAKMMNDMAVKPTGDVDRDFVAMMVPHHQGAIDMAVAVLRYGHNERIKRLAQEIIVTQQQEIAAMRLAVGDALPASQPSPTQRSITQPPTH